LIMTSNAGSREMSAQTIGFNEAKMDPSGLGQKAVEKLFSPEFRNRLDDTITFNPLDPSIMIRIVDKFIAELNAQLTSQRIHITLTPSAQQWLAQSGYDPKYGARPLARVIQMRIKDRLSDEILFGALVKGGHVLIDRDGDDLTFDITGAHAVAAESESV